MGNDPKTSVVDRHCMLHDVDNVFVADASVHVTNGGFNPVLTIMALAYTRRTTSSAPGAVRIALSRNYADGVEARPHPLPWESPPRTSIAPCAPDVGRAALLRRPADRQVGPTKAGFMGDCLSLLPRED